MFIIFVNIDQPYKKYIFRLSDILKIICKIKHRKMRVKNIIVIYIFNYLLYFKLDMAV